MSYGSISEEAHALPGRRHEPSGRQVQLRRGRRGARAALAPRKTPPIKQVASGRFGVTSEYLVSAKEIQIKLAQGAKPGEGGHLPGSKVWPWIARTRHSTPGVALISPPPHHDIYSIEDLAQLIYDLKCANRRRARSPSSSSPRRASAPSPRALPRRARRRSSSPATTAGPAPRPEAPSITRACPGSSAWPRRTRRLIANGLRGRVRLETDGKLMTGRDVAIACMLGAEEFGFATAPLVCARLRHDARVQSRHLPDGHCHPAPGAAEKLLRQARIRGEFHGIRRAGAAR